jgi:hypothetical protein
VTRSTLAAHGLRVLLGDRWEGRLYLREPRHDGPHPAAYGHPGESFNPVLHLANFALPARRGDFGTGAVETMGARHAFLALLEYDEVEAGRALFAASGVPHLAVRHFAGNALQRKVAGQLGCQRFFTEHGRPFCLYAVLGSRSGAEAVVREINDVLATLQVGSR